MANALDAQENLRQNLIDAGCTPETVRQCMALAQRGGQAELLRILSRQRRALLDAVHQNQERIDCLDYLVYRMQKEEQYTLSF